MLTCSRFRRYKKMKSENPSTTKRPLSHQQHRPAFLLPPPSSPHCVRLHSPSNDTQRKHALCQRSLPQRTKPLPKKLITIREQEHCRFHHTQYNQPATVRQASICSLAFQFSFPNLKSTPPLAPLTCSLAPPCHLWTEVERRLIPGRLATRYHPLVRASKSLCVLLSRLTNVFVFK